MKLTGLAKLLAHLPDPVDRGLIVSVFEEGGACKAGIFRGRNLVGMPENAAHRVFQANHP
jgi:hypothetical protein